MKKLIAIFSLTFILSSNTMIVNAQEDVNFNKKGIVVEEGVIATFSEGVTPRGIGYYASKDGSVKGDGRGNFQTTGWARMVNAKTNALLYHSTTAAVANYYDTAQYKGAVKRWGTGTVYSTSNWVYGWSWPKIMYSL